MAETEGDYQFKTISDDGSRLYIDNALVVDNDGLHAAIEKKGEVVRLPRGAVPFQLAYFQGPATNIALQVFYKGPGVTSWTIVPQSLLRILP